MAKDYKNSGRKKKRDPIPGWLWALTGLSVGLLVALVVYLQGHPPPAGQPKLDLKRPTPDRTEKQTTGTQEAKKPENNDRLRFEFYTRLPESEVVVPQKDLDREMKKQAEQDADRPPQENKGAFLLQAGSFKNLDEAETLKGELALLGVVAHIQNVTIKGDTWHRVHIGPFSTYDEIQEIRSRLRDNDINTIALKVKH